MMTIAVRSGVAYTGHVDSRVVADMFLRKRYITVPCDDDGNGIT